MRHFLFASVAAAALIVGGAVHAQTVSAPASNIDAGDTHSEIAPRLPAPPISGDAGPQDYLRTAERALDMNRTGEAQEALERAEARSLDRSADASVATAPDHDAVIQQVSMAREQLGHGDLSGARRSIAQALNATTATAPAPVASSSVTPNAAAAAASAGASPAVASGGGFVGPKGTDDAPGNFGQGTIPGTNKTLDDLGPTNTGEAASSAQN